MKPTRALFTRVLLPLLVMLPFVAAEAQTLEEDPAHAIANAYGLQQWDQVQELRFTFNVGQPEPRVSRAWTWRPHTGEVTQTVDGEAFAFNEKQVTPESPENVRKAHQQFINDTYWLLFPFQLVWSDNQITDQGTADLPIGEGQARKITVSYPSGGYTPGDAYDLYVGDDHRIRQWVFRRGGKPDGNPATWEGNQQLGPITVATDHRGGEGSTFRLYFTDLDVKTAPPAAETHP